MLITPYRGKPTPSSPSTFCSHYALRSRHDPTQRTTQANRVRQPHQLHLNQRHMHMIEIKYCEDTRPGQQLEAAQRHHADLCKLISAKVVTLHTILLGHVQRLQLVGLSHASSCAGPLRKKETKMWVWHGRGGLGVVLRRPIITSFVCVDQICSPRTFAKSFDDHSSSNIVALSLHAGDDMVLAACEHVECTVYLVTAWERA
eukprot:1159422-Pelagomonas_calceolata.AAC.4